MRVEYLIAGVVIGVAVVLVRSLLPGNWLLQLGILLLVAIVVACGLIWIARRRVSSPPQPPPAAARRMARPTRTNRDVAAADPRNWTGLVDREPTSPRTRQEGEREQRNE